MKWQKGRRSSNVEDRRGSSGGMGGFGKSPVSGMRLKGGSMIFIIAIIWFFGGNLLKSFMGGGQSLPSGIDNRGAWTTSSGAAAPADGRDVLADILGNEAGHAGHSHNHNHQHGQLDSRSARQQLDDIFSGKDGIGNPRTGEEVLSEILQPHKHGNLVQQTAPVSRYPNDVDADFVTAILGSTEDVWHAVFPAGQYKPPKLVLYEHSTRSACGHGSAASGPFYCPADQKVYLDLDFFKELARLCGKGDFAQAYVIGHEVAHHVQQLTGTSQRMRRLQQQYPGSKNQLLMMLELQADCLAGVWAHHSHKQLNWLDEGDIREGMDAASAVGDDRLTKGMMPVESFTHGSSKQRQEWLMRGVKTGDVRSCNTFKVMAGLDGF